MKKSPLAPRKLVLASQTLRTLTANDLREVDGGAPPPMNSKPQVCSTY